MIQSGFFTSRLPQGKYYSTLLSANTKAKAMITGPQGTPYENGCFIFDIYLPGDYNAIAPMVSLMTTNGGKYRYNPNLYADGVSQPAVDGDISTVYPLPYTACTFPQRSQSSTIYILLHIVCSSTDVPLKRYRSLTLYPHFHD